MKFNYKNFHSFSTIEGKTLITDKGVKFIWNDTGISIEDGKVYLQLLDPRDDETHYICIDELDDFTLMIGEPIFE